MDWAAWTGDAVAVIALLASVLSTKQSRASRRVAGQARQNAEAIGRSMEISMQKMAESLAALAEQQPQTGQLPATAATEPRPPSFTIESAGGASYRLRNVSVVPATGVTFQVPEHHRVVGNEEAITVDLGPFQSVSFLMSPGAYDQVEPLGEIAVSCDQVDGPIFVPVP